MKITSKSTRIFGIVFLILSSFFLGFFVKSKFINVSVESSALRLGGFKFVRPLLICDTNPEKKSKDLENLENKLNDFINEEKNAKNVNTVSVYFQDFSNDQRIDINKDEKFNCASLSKVSLLIAYLKLAELDPKALYEKIKVVGGGDVNSGQEIKPKESIEVGKTYTAEELLEKMIKYSDNNSMNLLLQILSPSILESLYEDIQVPFPFDAETPEKFVFLTTKDISYFFRLLFNSTYLRNDLSEKALDILSKTDYNNGLVAGVPKNISVAHKFGLVSYLKNTGEVESRELHDCGIVYHSKSPYLLCIMTKSTASIANIEHTVKNISSIVYQYVDDISK